MALIISNFLTDHPIEENQEQIKKYYSSGLRGKKSNRLRNLFIYYNSSLKEHESTSYLSNWTSKLARNKKSNRKANDLLDYDAQTECLECLL